MEGKEALLALVRDLTYQRGPNVLDSLVLIAVPIYNADGNEKFADQDVNRREQNGPELVGTRANGQGLDLNRDYVKAEAPETRAALAMFDKWDPDVYVDLHTTDGSFHGFALTYSPSLNPASYAPGFAGDLTRDTIIPEIRARMHNRGFEIFDYGNFGRNDGGDQLTDTVKNGWYTYEHTPRYGTNYYGIRGRVSILSEAYSHDPFKRRVASTYAFVQEILSAAARHASQLEQIRSTADNVQEPDVPIRSRMTTRPFDAPIPFEVLTRTGDSFVPLTSRTAIANREVGHRAVFVSIHFNAGWRQGAYGIETYYNNSRGYRLAVLIQPRVIQALGSIDRGIRHRGYFVLRRNRLPAVLIECGFLTNPAEASRITDSRYRERIARAIAAGIVRYD